MPYEPIIRQRINKIAENNSSFVSLNNRIEQCFNNNENMQSFLWIFSSTMGTFKLELIDSPKKLSKIDYKKRGCVFVVKDIKRLLIGIISSLKKMEEDFDNRKKCSDCNIKDFY